MHMTQNSFPVTFQPNPDLPPVKVGDAIQDDRDPSVFVVSISEGFYNAQPASTDA